MSFRPGDQDVHTANQVTARLRERDFDGGWRFALADPAEAYADAHLPGYDDSGWRPVDLPHDWSIGHAPAPDVGTCHSGFLPGGLGWYRKTFTLSASLAGMRIGVEFDGVYCDCVVYVNGRRAGAHAYGYTGFAVDLTSYVHVDGRTPNVLAVEVRNPLPTSRWYSGSGIYRHVRFVVTEPVHVARHGVYVTTPDLAATYPLGYATVRVRTSVAGGPVRAEVTWRVRDPDGRVVATSGAAVGGDVATSDLRVPAPVLWSADRPALYALDTEVSVDGRVVDAVATTFGLRWFGFDPDAGFSLNGTPMKLHGVNLHHDQGALGAVSHRDAVARQVSIMQAMGANAVRTAHNPPSPELVDVCERQGVLLMVEAFDNWRVAKMPYDYARFFDANADADITEMVEAARNSPAVVMWSIGNEIHDTTEPYSVPIARRLIDAVRAADPARPVVIGSDKYRTVPAPGSPQDEILRMLDGVGLNYDTAEAIDALHARYPRTFFFESESSAHNATRGFYRDPDLPNTGDDHTPGRRAASSYENSMPRFGMNAEYALKLDRDRPFLAGQFRWSGFDYIGEPTPYDDVYPVRTSFFGAVDTAGFPKDMYYLYASQWTRDPMVHLLPMDWTTHAPGEIVQVWAYTNAETVELLLNGRSLGPRRLDHDLHAAWSVPFEPGHLIAVARRNDEIVATDELRTAGPPSSIHLTPDHDSLPADGRSLAYITAEIVDTHGVSVPNAAIPVTITLTTGHVAGMDNGRQENPHPYQTPTRPTYNAKSLAIIQAPTHPGPITATATAPGLHEGTTTIQTTTPPEPVSPGPAPAEPASATDRPMPPAPPAQSAGGAGAGEDVRPQPDHWEPVAAALSRSSPARSAPEPAPHAPSPGAVPPRGSPAWPASGPRAVASPARGEELGVEPPGAAGGAGSATPPAAGEGVAAETAVRPQPGHAEPTGAAPPRGSAVRAGPGRASYASGPEDGVSASGPSAAGGVVADASFSGGPDTLPAAMLDGDPSTGWSNRYVKAATAVLPAVSRAQERVWVSLGWAGVRTVTRVRVWFGVDEYTALPRDVSVAYWDGAGFVPVRGQRVTWEDGTATIGFESVDTALIRLDLTSAAPGSANGFIRIIRLEV